MIQITKNIYRAKFPKFYDKTVFFIHFFSVFQSLFTIRGTKERARKIFYSALYFFYLEFNAINPLIVFYEIFNRERPLVLLINRKLGGVNHKIPIPISTFKSFSNVFQLFKKSVLTRTDFSTLQLKFFIELRTIYLSDQSNLRKKRLEINRLAYLNQSYIRSRRLKLCIFFLHFFFQNFGRLVEVTDELQFDIAGVVILKNFRKIFSIHFLIIIVFLHFCKPLILAV